MLQTPHFKMVFAVFGLCLTPAVSWSDDTFRDQVAPILQRRCLSCHNDEELKGDLSLQSAKAAFADGYIERGDSSASYLLDVITPQDGSAQMPKDADPLSTEEIALIRDWIDSGADWPKDFLLEAARVDNFDWWSYRPLQRPNVPELNDDWVQTPIDAFVLQRLNELDLSHNESADRRTLIRRVTYDLTGLPPTPKEVEQFVNDPDPRSYEKLVDRLLESDRYGERWARHWLDVVKYADTQGYDKDKLRPNAWPYRDYVIRSFNEDKPYGRFVQEQIAGDVLFPGEPDGILGLGFIAAGPWDFIGHVEVSSEKMDGMVARNLDRDDMVANTLNTFCSVTVQCARCHNHKFDPITQEHYYGLQSMFAAVDRAERPYDLDSGIAQQRRALLARLSELRGQEQKFNAEVAKAGGPQLAELAARIGELEATTQIVKEPEFGYHSDFASRADVEKWVEVDLGQPMELVQIVLRPCHDDFGGIGAGFGFPMRFRVEGMVGDQWRMILDRTESDVSNPGVNPVEISVPDSTFRKIRVTATRLADRQDVFIFALAELQALRKDGTNAALGAEVASLDSIEAPVRWGRKNLTDGRWARSSNDSQQNELALARRQRDEILAGINTPERAKRFSDLRQAVQKTEDQLAGLPERQMVFAATTQFEPQGNFQPTNGTLRDIHVLHRGNVQQPKEPAIPCVIPLSADDDFQFDPDLKEGERRAALSRWLTDPDHPLVWRSIVNRIWQYHFGRGIVETPNDFGRMGALPSHPELLDWLAVEFRDGGQSMKSLHRLIVTSSVYRQSSQQNAANAQVDSSNQFLWRMNRRRLEAEEIRDSILSVTGVLDLTMGGPGFYLFELEKTEHSPHYEYHLFDPADPASHRRSIYRFIVRSQPDPWMTTFDCADSSQSTPRRTESLTALQALSLMNSRFNLVMAKRFAARLESESPDLETQVELAMQWTLQRAPTDFERADLLAYAQNYGLTNLCRVVLNFSEFVFVD